MRTILNRSKTSSAVEAVLVLNFAKLLRGAGSDPGVLGMGDGMGNHSLVTTASHISGSPIALNVHPDRQGQFC